MVEDRIVLKCFVNSYVLEIYNSASCSKGLVFNQPFQNIVFKYSNGEKDKVFRYALRFGQSLAKYKHVKLEQVLD